MRKAKLTLVSARDGLNADEAKQALAALYQKSESHFDVHCLHLFELKQPFVHLKKVELAEAKKHLERLNKIGINCQIDEIEIPDELSLTPLAPQAKTKAACPACEQPSDDPVVCDCCGVIMKKFADQQKIDEQLQNKIATAERTDQRIKKAQRDAAEQNKKKGNFPKSKSAVTDQPAEDAPEEDIFTVKVVDKSKNKILTIALACAVLAAIGGGYLAYSLKTLERAEGTDYEFEVVDESVLESLDESEDSVVAEAAETVPIVESTRYSEWRSRLTKIEKLKHQLDALNSATGMDATKSGLIASLDDPLLQTVGEQYSAQQYFKKNTNSSSSVEYTKRLRNSTTVMQSLRLIPDRLYAALNLGKTYEAIGNPEEAKAAYGLAETYALNILETGNASDIVMAEVMVAEYQMSKRLLQQADAHFAAAITAAETIQVSSDDDNARSWAIAYIARTEAKYGQFVGAYKHGESISNEQIQDIVMEEISGYAFETPADPLMQALDANERDFADDPELMLLFQNTRKMKANAKKISTLTDH